MEHENNIRVGYVQAKSHTKTPIKGQRGAWRKE